MGHLVGCEELESLEKPETATISVSARTASSLSITSSTSSSTTSATSSSVLPQPQHLLHHHHYQNNFHSQHPHPQHPSPTHSQAAKWRRIQGCAGNGWHDCIRGASGLLPSPYAERWLRCLEQLLQNEGPLPESWRIYIAILALCRHEVTWAVRALTFEFISADGDRKWLSGLRFAPLKLRALATINNILAHRPWLLTSQHILDLTKGEESWSMSELCQALCLMTHFHSFASFLHACLPLPPPPSHPPPSSSPHPNSLPVTPWTSPSKAHLPSSLPDTFIKGSSNNSSSAPLDPLHLPLPQPPSATVPQPPSATLPLAGAAPVQNSSGIPEDSTNHSAVSPSKKALSSPSSISLSLAPPPSSSSFSSSSSTSTASSSSSSSSSTTTTTNGSSSSIPISIPQLLKNPDEQNGSPKPVMGSFGGAKREIQASPQPSKQSKNEIHSSRSPLCCQEEVPSSLREFPHLCHDISFTYQDFSRRSSPGKFFMMWEFNWRDHGYSLMTRLLNEMGSLLDEKFGAVKTLSHLAWVRNEDNSFNYRKAVWNYIQSFYGIHHEDYLYSQIDHYLSQEVKLFIKKCCCWPERLEGKVPAELADSTDDNGPSQLVPLSIIIMEARIESELLYALRAIIPHQS